VCWLRPERKGLLGYLPRCPLVVVGNHANSRVFLLPGTAPTGRPHCGYFVAAIKIAQLLTAGLLADIHGFLDNLKAPIELVEYRVQFYRLTISLILESVSVSTEKLQFVLGSSYQKSLEYVMDVYRLCSLVLEHEAKKTGAEIVKQSDNAPLSGLLYPILWVLDEQYLDVDAQFGGTLHHEI
jgi:tyrosyl-tRNA synthetase